MKHDLRQIKKALLPTVCFLEGRAERSTGYPFEGDMRFELHRAVKIVDGLI